MHSEVPVHAGHFTALLSCCASQAASQSSSERRKAVKWVPLAVGLNQAFPFTLSCGYSSESEPDMSNSTAIILPIVVTWKRLYRIIAVLASTDHF